MALATNGLTVSDVKTALSATSNALSDLCTHSGINLWSKRKPVRDIRITIPGNEVGKTQVGQGSGAWGIQLESFQKDDSIGSTYLQPTGGTYPYRLGDFRGYYHDATPPIQIPSAPSRLPTSSFSIDVIAQDQNDESLTLKDFGLRMGAYVYDHDTELYIGSATSNIDGGSSIPLDFSNLSDGDSVDIYFCMAYDYKPWSEYSGITGAYEPFRTISSHGIIDIYTKNWKAVPVRTASSPSPITYFNIIDNISYISIEVTTYSYTGDLYVRITHDDNGNEVLDENIDLNITVSGTKQTFTNPCSWRVDGRRYNASIWIGDSPSGARDAETSFVALSTMSS